MAKDTKTGEVVKLSEKVAVYGTGKGIYHKAGEMYEVHPLLAGKLVKSGKASMAAPKK